MTEPKMKAVVGLSGGMDSTTLLSYLLYNGYEVTACTFMYGSKHNAYEKQAVKSILNHYKSRSITHIEIDLTNVVLSSDLLLSGGDIPEGHYEAESMKSTVVPGRNLMFASVMAAIAESGKSSVVCLGVHSGDHHIYPDCRPKFIRSVTSTVMASTDNKVGILTPFLDKDKTSILEYGYSLPGPLIPPYHLTRTCYKNQARSCGKCGSCQERLEAFRNIHTVDPIEYDQ